jgi:hypothetical protein
MTHLSTVSRAAIWTFAVDTARPKRISFRAIILNRLKPHLVDDCRRGRERPKINFSHGAA